MTTIRIGDRVVGDGHPCFVIAEAGSNHDGKLERAKKLIDVASETHADAIKFQTFEAGRLYNESSNKETVDLLSGIELRRDWHEELMSHAEKRGMIFLTSVFDEESADFLESLGIMAFKIASAEINHLPLITHVARKNKPMIISTGMADESDVQDAVDAANAAGNENLAILHCVSQYPTEVADVNLKAIQTLRDGYGYPVGFSDHTMMIEASIAAVAIGANIIEKHITTSRKLVGPDHSYATEPHEFSMMVERIRQVEAMLGDGRLEPPSQSVGETSHRRAIYAAADIPEGAILRKDMLKIVRPSPKGAVPPKKLDDLIGRKTKAALRRGDLLTYEAVDL